MSRTLLNLGNKDFSFKKHSFYPKERIETTQKHKLNELDIKFKNLIDKFIVYDFGGSNGKSYFSIEPNVEKWIVWELKDALEIYKKNESDTLKFYEQESYPFIKDKMCFFSNDAFHYHKNPLKFLEENKNRFDIIYLRYLYSAEETILVEQEGVGPVWLLSLDDLQDILIDYQIWYFRDSNHWENNKSNAKPLKVLNLLAVKKK